MICQEASSIKASIKNLIYGEEKDDIKKSQVIILFDNYL